MFAEVRMLAYVFVLAELLLAADVCAAAPETFEASDVCAAAAETFEASDVCAAAAETFEASDVCAAAAETFEASDVCAAAAETFEASDVCAAAAETFVAADVCAAAAETLEVETVQWLSSSSSSVSKNSSAKIKRCQKYVVVLYVRVKAFNIVRCIVCVRVCLCVLM